MPDQGVLSWGADYFRYWYLRGQAMPGTARPHSYSQQGKTPVLPTHARTHILQSRARQEREPLNLAPIRDTATIQVSKESELDVVQQALAEQMHGSPVHLFMGFPVFDMWAIGGAASGQTTWNTSRRTPWGLPQITKTTSPPKAWTQSSAGVDTALTVTTSAPSAGEIQIPDATGAHYSTVTTHSTLTGEFLRLLYPAELLVVIDNVSHACPRTNDFRLTISFREVFLGDRK